MFDPRDRSKPGAIGGRLRGAERGDVGTESEARALEYWANYPAWRERRAELLREVQELRLEQAARKARGRSGRRKKRTVEVRWGLWGDETKVAELLELNGMPRWIAFEERFIVAERSGAVLAAVRCRTQPGRLLLGLLVVDPWSEERALVPALYAGARTLASEIRAGDIVGRSDRHRGAYLREAGYHCLGAVWRSGPSRSVESRAKPPGNERRRRARQPGFLLWDLLFRRWGAWSRRA